MNVILSSLACCVVLAVGASGAEIYVSNGGSNANPGTQELPLASVAQAITQSGSSDIINLERGSTFREGALNLSGNRTLRAYGHSSAPLPVLTGSTLVTGWTPWASNPQVLTAPFTAGAANQLYLNSQRMTIARTPNTGWLRVDEGSGNNTIVDAELATLSGAAAGRWTGAQVRWRKWTWIYETRAITADNGTNTLTLGGTTTLDLTGIGSGYYIDNALAALDAPGEWYYDAANQRIYFYPPVSTDIPSMIVEAAWRPKAVSLNGGTLEDVAVQHYTTGLSIDQPSTVRGTLIQHISGNGIEGSWNAGGSRITGSTLRDVLDNGINWIENPYIAGNSTTLIDRNVLERIGTVKGLAGNGSWRGTGIALVVGKGMTVRLNRITETGYAGILPGGADCLLENNVLIRCMASLNDGAAIYTNANGTLIRGNIILDTVGDLESSQEWTPLGHGIWPEFLSKFRDTEMSNNTVYGSGGHGIWLPNNYTCLITGNILVSNRLAGVFLGGFEDQYATAADFQQNHTIQNNTLAIGAQPWQAFPGQIINLASWAAQNDYLLGFQMYADRDLDFGTMSGTRFLTRDGLDLIRPSDQSTPSLAQWITAENAWADPAPANTVGQGYLFINDTETAVNYTLPAGVTWQTLAGVTTGPTVSIPAYRSVLLNATSGSTTGLKPYYLTSPATTLAQFRSRHHLAMNGAQDLLNPAGDGVPNLLKYAFNMIGAQVNQRESLSSPNVGTVGPTGIAGLPATQVSSTGNQLELTFIRRKASTRPGIVYTVLYSSSLAAGSWAQDPAATEQITSVDDVFERVTTSVSLSGVTKRFARVKVSVE